MIVQLGMLFLAASAQRGAAPEPARTSALPADCGLTEEQVIELAIPKYGELVDRARHGKPEDRFENFFEAFVAGAVKTDLGILGRSFLIAAVSVQDGECDGCYSAILLAIDLRARAPSGRVDFSGAWLSRPSFQEYDGAPAPPPTLRVFRVFPDDPLKTVAFEYGAWDPFHGSHGDQESWFRPRLDSNGSLAFAKIWDSLVGVTAGGIGDIGWPFTKTTTMKSLWPRHGYRLVTEVAAGWDQITIVLVQTFNQDPTTLVLTPAPPRVARMDNLGATTFPFDLPNVSLTLDPASLRPAPPPQEVTAVLSPDGEFCAHKVFIKREARTHLRVNRSRDGVLIRDVWSGVRPSSPGGPDRMDGLLFGGVGWTADGSRCIAVINLGLNGVPPVLVSIAPDGTGDRWEGFLPEGYRLPNGFILDLPEPSVRPAPHSHRIH